jgi:squalene-hopene/tetraprenyl-beta-curcumene cyclase
MKRKIIIYSIILVCIIMIISSCAKKEEGTTQLTGTGDYTFPLSLQKEAMHSIDLAYEWLMSQQFREGSWKSHPAITSLVLYSLVIMPGDYPAGMKRTIEKGYEYLEGFVQEDGGIYQNEYRNYTTSVALMAFAAYGKDKHREIIANAKDFLILYQCDESEGYTEEDVYYGGIGYGGDERPDLSNTQLALEAIKAAEDYETRYSEVIDDDIEDEKTGLHWGKALVFLARCQNASEVNNMPYRSDDDGGFMYETGTYNDDRSHSYGSMTYAGVKSLLYADVERDDIRVQRAMDWIKNNYTLEENPGFGTTSIYYYYMTFSKCLTILGDNVILDSEGNKHYWREDIRKKMVSLQHEEGYWENSNGRYWENIKDLATAYSVVAMKFAFKGLKEEDIK